MFSGRTKKLFFGFFTVYFAFASAGSFAFSAAGSLSPEERAGNRSGSNCFFYLLIDYAAGCLADNPGAGGKDEKYSASSIKNTASGAFISTWIYGRPASALSSVFPALKERCFRAFDNSTFFNLRI